MSNRLDFDLVCPNGHNVSVEFSQEEFEDALKSGTLQFHCNTCDTDWTPTSEEMAKFRKLFSERSS
jgi:hypothetical protein